MAFQKRKLFENRRHPSSKPLFTVQKVMVYAVAVACILVIVFLWSVIADWVKQAAVSVGKGTASVIARSVGTPMKTDANGHINVLILGYGGANHGGAYLSDTIMIASYDPKAKAVTFLSVPRDLYINKDDTIYGKINVLLAYKYNRTKDMGQAAQFVAEKLTEMTHIELPYYALIDFQGFKAFIDSIGGITIDVPYDIHDSTFPADDDINYITYDISKWIHFMSGEAALMYARSRHNTSDFARSYRQQQIIKAVTDKLLSSDTLSSVSKINDIYNKYSQMVTTNISAQEIIGMMQYTDSIKHMFSFGLTDECGSESPKLMKAGCFLYVPSRDLFGGLSVLIPDGASPSKISYYDNIQNFADYVVNNQGYLIENARIQVYNGIDPAVAKKYKYNKSGLANDLAVKLKKYGFNVVSVDKAPQSVSGTTIIINGTGDFIKTLDILPRMVSFSDVQHAPVQSGVDMTIVVGNDFMDTRGTKPFDFDQ